MLVTNCEQRSTLKNHWKSSKRLPLPRGRHALPPPQRRPLVVPLYGRSLLATVHFAISGLPTLGSKRSRPKRGALRWLPTRRPKSLAKIPLPQRSENSGPRHPGLQRHCWQRVQGRVCPTAWPRHPGLRVQGAADSDPEDQEEEQEEAMPSARCRYCRPLSEAAASENLRWRWCC